MGSAYSLSEIASIDSAEIHSKTDKVDITIIARRFRRNEANKQTTAPIYQMVEKVQISARINSMLSRMFIIFE